jgi:hypothetical protein
MANHFVAINRGQNGFLFNDFVTGAASNAGSDVEIRVADGANLTRKDIDIAIEAFERFFENKDFTTSAGIVFVV